MKPLSPFKQGFLGGLASLLLVALLVAAGAVLAQEPYDPNKDIDVNGIIDVVDIQEVAASWNTTGSPRGALVVFGTTTEYTGNPSTGYGRRGMHEACRLEDPDSHFCSAQEIEYAMMTTGVTFLTHAAMWVDVVTLGSLADGFNGIWVAASDWYGGSSDTSYPYNCNGWTSASSEYWGYALNTGALGPSFGHCNATHPIACCK
jgi:hypothetical protein